MMVQKDEMTHSSAHSRRSPLVGAMGPFEAVGGARVDGVAGVGGTEGREPGGLLSALWTRVAVSP